MTAVRLSEVPGYLPPGEVGSLDRYVSERSRKGETYWDIAREIIERERQDSIQSSGFAPYVGFLVAQLAEAQTEERPFLARDNLTATALTDLFAQYYNVAIDDLTENGLNTLRMFAATYPDNSFGLDYQFTTRGADEERGRTWSFWQLGGYATHGFINLSCVGEARPLEGRGNIAFIPGVEEALTTDIRTLAGVSQ